MASIHNNFHTPKLHGPTTPHVKSPIVSKKEETETTAFPTESTVEFSHQAHAQAPSHAAEESASKQELHLGAESFAIATPAAHRTHHSHAPLSMHEVSGVNPHGEDQVAPQDHLHGIHSTKLVTMSGIVRANLNPLGL